MSVSGVSTGGTPEPLDPQTDAAASALAGELEAIKGSGPSLLSFLDAGSDVRKLGEKLARDGTLDAADVKALVTEAKDFGRLNKAEKDALAGILRQHGAKFAPEAREALARFVGVAPSRPVVGGGTAPLSPGAREAAEARGEFVSRVLETVPRGLRMGPQGGALLERVGDLADAVVRAEAYRRDHDVYRDEDVRAVNEAAARVTALDAGFTMSDVDAARREKVPALVLDTVNLFARLGGRTLHEGKWDGKTWTSWNREVEAVPERYLEPKPPAGARSRAETFAPVADVVRGAKTVRVVGGGHSFNESASTGGTRASPTGTMLSLDGDDRLGKVPPAEAAASFGVSGERADRLVRVQAGARLRDVTQKLWDMGLALPVQGSTDAQSVGGLIATDLHGTGRDAAYLSERLREVTLVKADGGLVTFKKQGPEWATDETPPRRFEHLPVTGALGTLGVVVEAVLELDPAYNVEKKVQYVPRAEAERNLDDLLAKNDHVSFYYPGGVRDPKTVRLNTWNRTDETPKWTAPLARLAHEVTDHAAASFAPGFLDEVGERDARTDPLIKTLNRGKPEVLPAPTAFPRRLFYQHDEIEYGIPKAQHKAALDAVMKLLADEEFKSVVEVRFAPDTTEALIGPGTAGRGQGGTCFIELATAKGQYSEARIAEVYAKFDAVLREYGGRPHLGKKTPMTGADMAATHGEDWRKFQELRREWDPTNRFLPERNVFLNKIFG